MCTRFQGAANTQRHTTLPVYLAFGKSISSLVTVRLPGNVFTSHPQLAGDSRQRNILLRWKQTLMPFSVPQGLDPQSRHYRIHADI